MVVKTKQNFLFQKPVHNPNFKANKFLGQMKRFATLNHQNLLENLRNTEVVFYDTLFKSEKLNLNSYLKK